MNLPTTRQVLAVHGDGQLRRIEQPMPEAAPGTVLIRVGASLVSHGSELRGGWRALRAMQKTPDPSVDPRPIGYSVGGEVLAVGEGVGELNPGDRVAAMAVAAVAGFRPRQWPTLSAPGFCRAAGRRPDKTSP